MRPFITLILLALCGCTSNELGGKCKHEGNRDCVEHTDGGLVSATCTDGTWKADKDEDGKLERCYTH